MDKYSRIFLALLASLVVPAIAIGKESLHRHTMQHDGIEREYFVHVPVEASAPRPLVVAIHGYTSTATGFSAWTGLNRHADEHGYVVVYPQGSHFLAGSGDAAMRVTSWNDLAANQPETAAGPHCIEDSFRYPRPPECSEFSRCAWTSCYDDVGFLEKVLDAMTRDYQIDPRRVYLLGVSNGGMMTLRLGCNLSDRFAAIAPIVAQLAPGYDCGPQNDLPMLHLFGGQDNVVRADGKPGGDGFIYTSAAKTTATWAAAMACAEGPIPWRNALTDAGGLECTAYRDCNETGHEVVSCGSPNSGHTWPGQGVAGMPATCVSEVQSGSMPGQARCPDEGGDYAHAGMDLVWSFFARYSNPAPNSAD